MIARPRLGAPSSTAKCPSMRRITSRNFSGWPTRKFSRIKQKRDQIRLMTNSHKSQSEKPATGGGRETTAVKPYNNEVPGPHH